MRRASAANVEIKFNPDGDPENGIGLDILQIRLAMESKRWDVMVDRIDSYLEKTKDKRQKARDQKKQEMIEKQKRI